MAEFSLPLWPCTVVTPISPSRHTRRHMHCFVMVLAVCVVPTEPREEAPVCVHSPAADHGDVGQGGLGSRKSFHNRPHQLHSPAAMLTTSASLPVAVNSVLDEGFIPVVPCTMAHRGCVYGAVYMSFGGDMSFFYPMRHTSGCASHRVSRAYPSSAALPCRGLHTVQAGGGDAARRRLPKRGTDTRAGLHICIPACGGH